MNHAFRMLSAFIDVLIDLNHSRRKRKILKELTLQTKNTASWSTDELEFDFRLCHGDLNLRACSHRFLFRSTEQKLSECLNSSSSSSMSNETYIGSMGTSGRGCASSSLSSTGSTDPFVADSFSTASCSVASKGCNIFRFF